jgi:hypothetical protein
LYSKPADRLRALGVWGGGGGDVGSILFYLLTDLKLGSGWQCLLAFTSVPSYDLRTLAHVFVDDVQVWNVTNVRHKWFVLKMYSIQSGQSVLVVWGSTPPPETFQNIIGKLQKLTGPVGRVSVENVDRLAMGMYLIHEWACSVVRRVICISC